jgi:pimeloyl-ACP methyl ester carboxylesterase
VTLLAWQSAGAAGRAPVVLVHGWASDGVRDWQDTGWVAALERAGFAVYVPDLPGHGESADVVIPDGREPAAWAAEAVLADLARLRLGAVAVAGTGEGCLVAGHLAARAPDDVAKLVLVGVDDVVGLPNAAEIAAGLRDPTARVWHAEAAEVIVAARTDRRHDLATLATWVERAAWPAAARLGALRTPVLLAVGADDPRRERAPRLARLFHDARLVTVPGAGRDALAAPQLVDAVADFLRT